MAGAGQFQGVGKQGSPRLSETPPECQESCSQNRKVVEEATQGVEAHRMNRYDLLLTCGDHSGDSDADDDSDTMRRKRMLMKVIVFAEN